MPRAHKPRAGSLQYWPRKRASRIYPRIRAWKKTNELKLMGFCGYKVGMTHLLLKDSNPHSATKEYNKNIDDINLGNIKDIKILIYTQPKLTTLEKKKPEVFEVDIGGSEVQEKLNFAKSLLDKELKVSDYFKQGQFVDIHAITKGKGLQGPVKRFGINLKSHKSEKKRRAPANLGPWTPSKVSFRVPQKGQMGFHTRTIFNNIILDIQKDSSKITPKSMFKHYGNIKNEYLLLRGSVPGPYKRLIRFSEAIRPFKKAHPINISYISVKNES